MKNPLVGTELSMRTGRRTVGQTNGQTDRQDEANSRVS